MVQHGEKVYASNEFFTRIKYFHANLYGAERPGGIRMI